jgi:hypothetical protein
MVGDIKSERRAKSFRKRGRHRAESADDGVATLEDKATPDKQSVAGTWKISSKRDRYLITFGEQETSFERITPPGADMCILAAGGAYAVNLRLSWFAIRPEDGAPDE